jgi:tryptophan synthase beta chain
MQCFARVSEAEGILPAIETAHAFAGACDWGREQVAAGRDPKDLVIVVNTSGRGDKDVDTAARWFELLSAEEIAAADLEKARPDVDEGSGEGW